MSAVVSSERSLDAILECRGRRIGFRHTRFGGEIHAVDRGYFPCSSTGYRSLGRYAFGDNAPLPGVADLEALAVEQDKVNVSLLKRCHRALRAPGRPNGVDNFIYASGAADCALAHGFFADPALRADLWRSAFRIYTAIIDTPEAHPGHSSQCLNRNAWTPDYCVSRLQLIVDTRTWLRDLLDGTFVLPDWPRQYLPLGAASYFDLPAAAEARVGAPSLDMSLGLEITASSAACDSDDNEDSECDDFADDDALEDADLDEADSVPVTVTSRLVAVIRSDAQMSLF